MNTNVVPTSENSDPEFERGWYDSLLNAEHWFSLQVVGPTEAALLLLQFNPDEESFEHACEVTQDGHTGFELKILRRHFEDEERASKAPKNLNAWLRLAQEKNWPRHPWADNYAAENSDPPQDRATTEDSSAAHVLPNGRSFWKLAGPYVVALQAEFSYRTAKRLLEGLLDRAVGDDSPFTKGTGDLRGSLLLRETARPIGLKVIQNNWAQIRREALVKK